MQNLFVLSFSILLLCGCTSMSPLEYKEKYGVVKEFSVERGDADLAACMVEHMEDIKFFLSSNRVPANSRKGKNGWHIYAMSGEYMLYLVEINRLDDKNSRVALFHSQRGLNQQDKTDAFVRGIAECKVTP